MRRAGGVTGVILLLICLCLAATTALEPVWAKEARQKSPGLWIAADRIVGFVPFTVYVYGKVAGAEPGQLELCRTEAAWIAESANARRVEIAPRRGSSLEGRSGPDCEAGALNRTPAGYDYAHDMRFDRPGTYQIRLVMVDAGGTRTVSNVVHVRAF